MNVKVFSSSLMMFLLGMILLEQISQTALASDGSLILPSKINHPVTLRLTGTEFGGDELDYSNVLQVFVGKRESCCVNRRPIAGRYSAHSGFVTFVPAYAFVEGQNYVVRVSQRVRKPVRQEGTDDSPSHTFAEFHIKSSAIATQVQVTKIYPSGISLPENVLRFYIHFSESMKPHVAFDHIKLIDASGAIDDAAFMKFKQELWSEDRKRLTVLMDPGRVKRSVSTNLRLGPALSDSKRYKLVVQGGWPAANGEQTLTRYTKTFTASAALRELPDVESWAFTVPSLGTKAPLKIGFDRPFDYQLLRTAIKVLSESGEEVSGEIFVEKYETALRFRPSKKWTGERIHIVVDSELEDVAGNNFKDLLDHSVEAEIRNIQNISLSLELR